jgi:hypothetical protein
MWIHGMSPPEIVHLSHLDKKPVYDVIGELHRGRAGLDPRRRRRDPGRAGAQGHRAEEGDDRRMARRDAAG